MLPKSLLIACIFVLPYLSLIAQTGNPYKDIHKKATVITLTNNQYDEFFDEDSIQRIGSVLVNINTMKIVKLLDSKEEERKLDNSKTGRFLSVDPLTRSFAELSPYQYASNTPIQAIDLDGLEKFVVIDGPTPGTVIVELQNYTKRDPAKNQLIVHGMPPATYHVEDLRKAATGTGTEIFFPLESLQALFGGSFITDAGVVYIMGDPSYANTALKELGVSPQSKRYNTPMPVKMDAANGATNEKLVLYNAGEFPVGAATATKEKTVYTKIYSSINSLNTRYDEFGRGKSSITENFITPTESAGDVKVNLMLSDNGRFLNSFTVLDADGNQLANFESTENEHSRMVEFSLKPGSKFSIKVKGDPNNRNDNYSINGTVITSRKITFSVPENHD